MDVKQLETSVLRSEQQVLTVQHAKKKKAPDEPDLALLWSFSFMDT